MSGSRRLLLLSPDPCLGCPQIKFEQGTVQTPELLQDIEIPESVTVLGQSIDLTTLKAALQPVTTSLRSAVEQVCGCGGLAQFWMVSGC